MASKRQEILAAVKARLVLIEAGEASESGGDFETDAGAQVFVNESPALSDADPNVAIAVLAGDDEIRVQGNKIFVDLPIEIHALAKAELTNAWTYIEPVLADIKRAMELADRTLGGLVPRYLVRRSTRTLEREPGSTAVGVSIGYLIPMDEQWGNP